MVDAYLTEIAKAYSVNWSVVQPRPADSDDTPDGGATVGPIAGPCYLPFLTTRMKESTEEKADISDNIPKASITSSSAGGRRTPKLPDIPPTEDEAKGKSAATAKSSTPPPIYKAPPEDDFEALTRRFEALKKR